MFSLFFMSIDCAPLVTIFKSNQPESS